MSEVQARCIDGNAYEANLAFLGHTLGLHPVTQFGKPGSSEPLFLETQHRLKPLYHTFLRKGENYSKFLNIEWSPRAESNCRNEHTKFVSYH